MLPVRQDRAVFSKDDHGPVFRIAGRQGVFRQEACADIGEPAVEIHLEEAGTVRQELLEDFRDEGRAAGFQRNRLVIQPKAFRRKAEALRHFVSAFLRNGGGGGRFRVDHRAVAAAEAGLQLDEGFFIGRFGLAADLDLPADADLFESRCRGNHAVVQGAHHDDGLDDAGRAEAVSVVRLDRGREDVAQPGVLDGLGFHLVVEHGRRTVRRDAGEGGFPLRGQDLLDSPAHPVSAGDGCADMVGVVVEAAVDDVPGIRILAGILGQDHGGGTLSDVEAQALDIERLAGYGRQGLEGVEAGQDKSREGIDAANDGRIVLTGSDQPVCQHLCGGAGNAGVADRQRVVGKTQCVRDFFRGDTGREIVPVFLGNVSQFFDAGGGSTQDQQGPRG